MRTKEDPVSVERKWSDRENWPRERALLSSQELVGRYRGALTMHFRQFAALLRPWVIYEHKNLILQAKRVVLYFRLLRVRKACEPPVVDATKKQ